MGSGGAGCTPIPARWSLARVPDRRRGHASGEPAGDGEQPDVGDDHMECRRRCADVRGAPLDRWSVRTDRLFFVDDLDAASADGLYIFRETTEPAPILLWDLFDMVP